MPTLARWTHSRPSSKSRLREKEKWLKRRPGVVWCLSYSLVVFIFYFIFYFILFKFKKNNATVYRIKLSIGPCVVCVSTHTRTNWSIAFYYIYFLFPFFLKSETWGLDPRNGIWWMSSKKRRRWRRKEFLFIFFFLVARPMGWVGAGFWCIYCTPLWYAV